LELDELWSCTEKSEEALSLDRPVLRHASGRRLLHQRPLAEELSETLGAHPGHVQEESLLQRLLGGVICSVIATEQHTAMGKESSFTTGIERWNNTRLLKAAEVVDVAPTYLAIDLLNNEKIV
jgi:hypothetical protein